MRILLTSSRLWADKSVIADAFLEAIDRYGQHLIVPDENGPRILWHRITVVHGAARGGDTIGGRIATAWGMRVEAHPADWERFGRSAGFKRNAEMVELGADVCLAFIINNSSGASHTARIAEAAGIPVRRYERTTAVVA